ncbi:hypothetical protein ABZS76_33465 [Streptomyces sp. NPDC005562]|uniref:hypothetical protein n=1 Tax=Streptomyces sp. NPDC005562 TaxID=3154890 RepID=UPI0033A604BA
MSVPILGQNQPDRIDREYGAVHQRSELAQGDLHDSEILEFEQALAKLMERYGERSFTLDEFEREAKERFHGLGFAIEVAWAPFTINGQVAEGALAPNITLVGRVDRTIFDHDQKVHEVTRNLLGIDKTPGVIPGGLPD